MPNETPAAAAPAKKAGPVRMKTDMAFRGPTGENGAQEAHREDSIFETTRELAERFENEGVAHRLDD